METTWVTENAIRCQTDQESRSPGRTVSHHHVVLPPRPIPLLAILICRPKAFERDQLDCMLREAGAPKVHDWLVNYVVKENPHSEELRVAKKPEELDLAGLLDVIESQMKDAPNRLQWAMNHCLAQIGIEHPQYRDRALDIGERLEVLKDYPTSPGCTSPFAPTWITAMVDCKNDKGK